MLLNIKNILRAIWGYSLIRPIVQFIPIRENKFFCVSMNGNNYGDSIKALTDYIKVYLENPEIVWGFSDVYFNIVSCPDLKTRFYSPKYYYHILTSKYVLSNCHFNHKMLIKRKGQIYLQTWHGTTLKKIGYDIFKVEKAPILIRLLAPDPIKHDNSMIDIFVSGSKYMSKIYREKFRYEGVLSEIGTPRNDIFFHGHPDVIEKVKKLYNIDSETGIILYAPTFRTDSLFKYYDLDVASLQKEWEQKTGRKYKVLVRIHSRLLKNESEFEKQFTGAVINASLYPDMQELLYATDLLVTDYSSSMFDYMYTHKPVIIYAPDRNEYRRGMYFSLEELPFLLIYNNSELGLKIRNFNLTSYRKKVNDFIDRIGSCEKGDAVKKTMELLLNI